MKNYLWFIVKLGIAFFLLFYLYQQGNLSLDSFTAIYEYPLVSMAVSAMFMVALFIISLRWKWLLSALDVKIDYKSLLDINFIGAFASIFLLGSMGGDAIRAYYITTKAPHKKAKVLLSLIVDRAIGLAAMIVIAAVASLMYYAKLEDGGQAHVFMEVILVFILLCVGFGIFALFFANSLHTAAQSALHKKDSAFMRLIVHILDAALIFRRKPLVVIISLVVSIAMQIGILWTIALVGIAMNIGDEYGLPISQYMTAGSFALLANSIPLTPGGIGIGEGAFNYFCELLNEHKQVIGYSSVFFAYRIITSLVSLIGLWKFLTFSRSKQ